MAEQDLDFSDIDFDSDPKAGSKMRSRFEAKYGEQKTETERLREENKNLQREQALRAAGLDGLDADKQTALWAVHGDAPVTADALKATATSKLGFASTAPAAAAPAAQGAAPAGPTPAQVAAAQSAAIGNAQGESFGGAGEFSTEDMKGWSSQRVFEFINKQHPEVQREILSGNKVPATDLVQ